MKNYKKFLKENSDSVLLGYTSKEEPIIAVWNIDGLLMFHCRYCKRIHIHGKGNGYRLSHCINPESDYYQKNYIIIEQKGGVNNGNT